MRVGPRMGAPVSGALVGPGPGCVWGCGRSRGVWCWFWCGMARCGFLGGFLVVVAGCSFVCVCGWRGVWALGYHSMGLGRFPVGPGHLPNVS